MVELLVYISIGVLTIAILTSFSAVIIRRASRAKVVADVHLASQDLLYAITQEVRQAQDIDVSQSSFLPSLQGRLALTDELGVLKKKYYWLDDTVQQVDALNVTTQLSPPSVRVTELWFEQVASGIRISFSVLQANPNVPVDAQDSVTLTSFVTPRYVLY